MRSKLILGTVCWLLGYIIAYWFPSLVIPLPAAALAFVLALLIIRSRLWVIRTISLILIVISGTGLYLWADQQNQTALGDWEKDEQEIAIVGRIVTPVEVDGDKVSFTVRTEAAAIMGESSPNHDEAMEEDSPISDNMDKEGVLTKSDADIRRLSEKIAISVRLLKQEDQIVAGDWQRGDEVSLHGKLLRPETARNFGGFDYRRYLRQQRVHWLVTVKGLETIETEYRPRWDGIQIKRWNDMFREWMGERLDKVFPGTQAGYMKGLLIGLRSDLDPQQFQAFSQLGLTHILAISGLHVAVFAGGVMLCLRWLRFTREKAMLVTIYLLPLYIIFTGSSPSVVRAGLMGMIALYAARRGWLKDGLHLLCAVGWVMLIYNPYYWLDVGFQLSFLVTLGLILGTPLVQRLLPIHSPLLASTISVALVAQWVSFPLSVYYFNQFSLLSGLANLLLVPLISFVVTPAGSVVLMISILSESIAKIIAWPVIQLNHLSFATVNVMDGWKSFHLIWPTPQIWWILLFYLFSAAFLAMLFRHKINGEQRKEGVMLDSNPASPYKYPLIAGSLFVGLIALLVYSYNPDHWNRQGSVQFIDVGQGDAILIHTPDDRNILIDGGGTLTFRKPGEEWKERRDPFEVGRKLLVPLLKKRGVHRLDMLIVSHGDSDHIGGLQAVLDNIPVDRLLFNATVKPNTGAQKLFQTALDNKVHFFSAASGTIWPLGGSNKLQFLYPEIEVNDNFEVSDSQNDLSLVFTLDMEGFRFLFTGDMEKKAEDLMLDLLVGITETKLHNRLLFKQQIEAIDVLKVAHHGSKTSTTARWLDYWQPKEAVISVGKTNVYGHPSPQVIERLENQGAAIHRTDHMGEVQMLVNKGKLSTRLKLDPQVNNK